MASHLERINGDFGRNRRTSVPAESIDWEDAWKSRAKTDSAHSRSMGGHELSKETGEFNGRPMYRDLCECGWTGEWRRFQ